MRKSRQQSLPGFAFTLCSFATFPIVTTTDSLFASAVGIPARMTERQLGGTESRD
jgi:hypothetical protein